MYQLSNGAQIGPGTALVERYGLGEYHRTQPYMLTPAGQEGILGMGCPCGMAGCSCGVGAFMDGTGFLGTGLFVSSDPASWGVGEWVAIALGGYVALSVFDTTRRGARVAVRKGKAVRKAMRA